MATARRALAVNWRILAALAIGIVAYLATGPLAITDRYQSFVITTVAIYAIVTISVSELAALSGIWSVGHMSFVAVGAYATAYLGARGYPLPLVVAVATLLAAAIGFVLGLSAGRFEVLYLAILTLALALVAGEVIGRWVSVTGGDQGVSVPPARVLGHRITLDQITSLAILTATAVFILVDIGARSRFGRQWLAVKNQRTAAVAIGLNPAIANASAFAASAAIAAVGGVVLALQIGYISPDFFSLSSAINFIVAAVVGGVGSTAGALLGAAFIVVLPEAARGAKDFQIIVFGALTIAVLLFVPEGIVPGAIRRGARMIRARPGPALVDSETGLAAEVEEWLKQRPGRRAAELVVENVTVRFGGLTANEDVSLRIPPGNVVALIGPNGAGKTTFLNVLAGFVRPVEGAVATLAGQDLLRMSPQRRPRAGIGRTFQHAELFGELSVLETVRLAAGVARRPAGESVTASAVSILDLLRLARYSDERPDALPFGIQKRIDIARALATGPSLVIMDEPFSGLDLNEQRQLHDLILAFRRAGISVLLVDHAIQEVLSLADRVYVLDYGRLIAEGTPTEIQASPAVQEAYFGRRERSA